ncbi:MAG: hypothetical protein J6W93_02955 [Clostridia bacterium]|nr:hypothetical protein [Clostridia bacterium]
MKKILCIILALSVCACALCACAKEEQKKEDVRKAMYSELQKFYENKRPADLNEAASLFAAGKDLKEFDCSALFAPSVSDPDYVAAYCLLKKANHPLAEGADAETRVTRLQSADIETLSTRELYETVLALTLYGAEFDKGAVAQSLILRQDEISGGSYEYPQVGGGSARVSAENAAYSLLCYMLVRDSVRTTLLEDALHDSALVYLGNCIEENNTVRGVDGKANSAVTAKALVALMVCGVPQNGEIATALLNAIHNFAVFKNGALAGYRETEDDDAKRSTAAEIMFCVTVTLYGNPYFDGTLSPAGGTQNN